MKENRPLSFGGKARQNLAAILNHALEEEVVLSTTMRRFLGRVTGPNFYSLYRLFGDQCRQIDRWLTEITDRAKSLGAVARAGAAEFTTAAAPGAGGQLPARNMVGELLALHEGIAQRLRADLAACTTAQATADFLARLVEFHETTAWMLRMVLDGPEVPRPNA